jgi:hypothetical protein
MRHAKKLREPPKKARKPRNVEVRKLVFRMLASPDIDPRSNVEAMQMHFEWIMSGKVPPSKSKDKPRLAANNAP